MKVRNEPIRLSREVELLRSLARNWTVIVGAVVASLVAAFIITVSRERIYESSAHLIVAPAPNTADTSDVIRSVETLDRRTVVATFARMTGTTAVQDKVRATLRLSPEEAAAFKTRASVVPNTNVIRISVDGPHADLAASIANTTAAVTAKEAESLYRIYTLRIVSRADAAVNPSFPDPRRNYTIALALGLFIGIGAALALERLRRPAVDDTLWG